MSKMLEMTHSDPQIRTFMLFMQMAQAVYKYSDRHFYNHGMTTATFVALKALVLRGGTMTHTELARWTNTKRHNITSMVARLKVDALVTTERDPSDRRIINVFLTERGRKAFEDSVPVSRSIMEAVLHGIEEQDLAVFEQLLLSMKSNVGDRTPVGGVDAD